MKGDILYGQNQQISICKDWTRCQRKSRKHPVYTWHSCIQCYQYCFINRLSLAERTSVWSNTICQTRWPISTLSKQSSMKNWERIYGYAGWTTKCEEKPLLTSPQGIMAYDIWSRSIPGGWQWFERNFEYIALNCNLRKMQSGQLWPSEEQILSLDTMPERYRKIWKEPRKSRTPCITSRQLCGTSFIFHIAIKGCKNT